MRLIIEILTRETRGGDRDGGYLAICNTSGELLSKAGAGGGQTPREAAQEAINSYYARRAADENRGGFVIEPAPQLSPTELLGAGSILDTRSESDPARVIAFLRECVAIEPRPRLTLTYTNAKDVETTRDIYPSEIKETRGLRGFREEKYLVAVDCDKDEPRTFRLDRIIKVRTASDA